MLGCNSLAMELGKKLIVFGASGEVRKAMELVGLTDLLPYAETQEAALKLAAEEPEKE